jgi:hypothetical protein
MPICFVIQHFDSGRFDKRFGDVYKLAIDAARLEAYRVDRNPNVEVPIEAIKDGIKNAAVCLADITTDNPNVWSVLGSAFAFGRPVVMVCSEECTNHRYPFDIQHRTVFNYSVEAPTDFDRLRASLTEQVQALLNKKDALRQIAESEQVATTRGLSQPELMVLANLAGDTALSGTSESLYSLKSSSEQSGLTPIGFSLAFRRLLAKQLVETVQAIDDQHGPYEAACLTDLVWEWVESNASLFVLSKKAKRSDFDELDDDIPS